MEKPLHSVAPQALRTKDGDTEHFVSAGERKFDNRAYWGFGYVLNVALSIAAVFAVERTGGGRKFLDALGKLFGKIPGLTPETAKAAASRTFFLTGGFGVLVPIKWMEDRKLELVKKWNREIYGDAADTDPAIIKSEQEIAEAPKQSWLSILGSRALALLPFYIVVGALWENGSRLSKITNSEYRAMDAGQRAAVDALPKAGDAGISQHAQVMKHGVFFDRLVVGPSRWIGKLVAGLTGNKEAVERIGEMEAKFPSRFKESANGAARDPNHSALPYYFICEAITSAIVARSVYLLTRVLGPILGKKQESAPRASAAPGPSEMPKVEELPKTEERPATQVAVHEAARLQAPQQQLAV